MNQANANQHLRYKRNGQWRTTEIEILKAVFPEHGIYAAAEKLPGRPEGSIRSKAAQLKLRAPAPSSMFIHKPSNPEIDRQIIEASKQGAPAWEGHISLKVKRSSKWVKCRAEKLGLQPSGIRPQWTMPEKALLAELAPLRPADISKRMAQAGYSRSADACMRMITALGMDRTDPDRYNCTELSRLLGVSVPTVLRWCADHGLKSSKATGLKSEHRIISRQDLRKFVAKNSPLVDLRKVEQTWFKDVMWGAA